MVSNSSRVMGWRVAKSTRVTLLKMTYGRIFLSSSISVRMLPAASQMTSKPSFSIWKTWIVVVLTFGVLRSFRPASVLRVARPPAWSCQMLEGEPLTS